MRRASSPGTWRDTREPLDLWLGHFDDPSTPAVTVYEPKPARVDTGLVDLKGQRIMREIPREPLGFLRFEDR